MGLMTGVMNKTSVMYHSRGVLNFVTSCGRRMISAATRQTVAEPLEQRGLLQVSGDETSSFLQGLITNDMGHIYSSSSAMFTMFLNTKGRVMYDAIVYRSEAPNTVLIECDINAVDLLERHLKMYRLRKKISIEEVKDLRVWAVFDPDTERTDASEVTDKYDRHTGEIIPCNILASMKLERKESLDIGSVPPGKHVLVFRDPRMTQLGVRVLCPPSEDLGSLLNLHSHEGKKPSYRSLRYKLGVGEGLNDHPPGNCFPLEANCDYLHGVSFHKGCYIGQELTARTHHTGVVRKRIMPLVFDTDVNDVGDSDVQILNELGKSVGKLRGIDGRLGLGLLRVSEALASQSLNVGQTNAHTRRPEWWPLQTPKALESRDKA